MALENHILGGKLHLTRPSLPRGATETTAWEVVCNVFHYVNTLPSLFLCNESTCSIKHRERHLEQCA